MALGGEKGKNFKLIVQGRLIHQTKLLISLKKWFQKLDFFKRDFLSVIFLSVAKCRCYESVLRANKQPGDFIGITEHIFPVQMALTDAKPALYNNKRLSFKVEKTVLYWPIMLTRIQMLMKF